MSCPPPATASSATAALQRQQRVEVTRCVGGPFTRRGTRRARLRWVTRNLRKPPLGVVSGRARDRTVDRGLLPGEPPCAGEEVPSHRVAGLPGSHIPLVPRIPEDLGLVADEGMSSSLPR